MKLRQTHKGFKLFGLEFYDGGWYYEFGIGRYLFLIRHSSLDLPGQKCSAPSGGKRFSLLKD